MSVSGRINGPKKEAVTGEREREGGGMQKEKLQNAYPTLLPVLLR